MYLLMVKYARDDELRFLFADVAAAVDAGAASVLKTIANNALDPSATNRLMQAAHEGNGGSTVNVAREEELNEDAHG